ncbi:uncharacterized protein LOC122067917 [Macadamia integrifolia]|uniref:uncharacterized protein LOC122067917 n=1 Tax=Macadamia integrifolia TaxID=60698 RepID=UPI001C4FED1A|nr:uncharacterized protein LOC122067917 [Macadamia integrifolia]
MITTQNVMCACSFDMKFTFVYAGWEGSANDCRVFNRALEDPTLRFPHPPQGKYYVVDSGYASRNGYLTPFKGERYHIPDYNGGRRQPRSTKELFNYRHSSLRNHIERCFGILKSRFPILKNMPQFSLSYQSYIVIACCGLHKSEQIADALFQQFGEDDHYDPNEERVRVVNVHGEQEDGDVAGTSTTIHQGSQRVQGRQMNELRIQIANQMAVDKGYPLI